MKRKLKAPNVVRGGIAIPVAHNTFLMKGRTHEQGGIDIGTNEKNGLEVEGNELIKLDDNQMKILSAQPILNGQSPAMLALRGNSFDKVFNAQERFKKVNHLNDDGSKARLGKQKNIVAPSIDDMYNNYTASKVNTVEITPKEAISFNKDGNNAFMAVTGDKDRFVYPEELQASTVTAKAPTLKEYNHGQGERFGQNQIAKTNKVANQVYNTIDNTTKWLPGTAMINWLSHMGADIHNKNYKKAAIDLGLGLAIGKGIKYGTKGLSYLYDKLGRPTFSFNIPNNENFAYRIVNKSGIDDAINSGLIKPKDAPYTHFSKGKPFGNLKFKKGDYIIETPIQNNNFGRYDARMDDVSKAFTTDNLQIGESITPIENGIPIIKSTNGSKYYSKLPIGYLSKNFTPNNLANVANYGNLKFIRNLGVVPKINDKGFVEIVPNDNVLANFTSDMPFRTHSDYRIRPGAHYVSINPSAFKGKTPLSIEPMDTIFMNEGLNIKPSDVTFISGDTKALSEAKSLGYNIDTNDELIKLFDEYDKNKTSDIVGGINLTKDGIQHSIYSKDYEAAIDRYFRSKNPVSQFEYKGLENITGLKSGVEDIDKGYIDKQKVKDFFGARTKAEQDALLDRQGGIFKYGNGRSARWKYFLDELDTTGDTVVPSFYNKVFYDPTPYIESDIMSMIGGSGHPKYKNIEEFNNIKKLLYENYINKLNIKPMKRLGGGKSASRILQRDMENTLNVNKYGLQKLYAPFNALVMTKQINRNLIPFRGKRFALGGDESRVEKERNAYLDNQRQSIIDAAVQKALNRTQGVAPVIVNEDGHVYNGASCLYTYTDNFGKKYKVASNQAFAANPEKYGWKVNGPIENTKLGDMYQMIDGGVPNHAAMITNIDNNNRLISYSSGGAGSPFMEHLYSKKEFDIIKSKNNNPNKSIKTENSLNGLIETILDLRADRINIPENSYDEYVKNYNKRKEDYYKHDYKRNVTPYESEQYETYRFIGTPEDNAKWKADWRKQYESRMFNLPIVNSLDIPNVVKRFGGNMNLINNLPRKGKQFAFGGDDKKKQKDYHRDALPLGMRFKTFIEGVGDAIKETINPTTDEERLYRFLEYMNDRNSVIQPKRKPVLRRNNYNFRQPDSTVIDRAKIKEFKCGGRHKALLGTLRTTPWGTTTYMPSLNDTLNQPLMYANSFTPRSIYDTISKTKPVSDVANTDKQSFWDTIKTNMGPADWVNLGTTAVNTIGNIASYAINNRMLNRLTYPRMPIAMTPEKLKTTININPQLSSLRNTLAATERDITNNTASSRVAQQRIATSRSAGLDAVNQLYGTKENYETQLINQDRNNSQAVRSANIDKYYNWDAGRHTFRNNILDKKSENIISHLIQGPADDLARFANNYQTITKYDNDLLMSTIPYPEAFKLMFRPAMTKNGIDKNAWARMYGRGRIGYNLLNND